MSTTTVRRRVAPYAGAGVGVGEGDGNAEAETLARKVAGLRVFADGDGKMNLSLADLDKEKGEGAVLAVSQFTLYADVRKGRRPSFVHAAPPEVANRLYERFCAALAHEGLRVERGIFQAEMLVALVNDGPVTILIDTNDLKYGPATESREPT